MVDSRLKGRKLTELTDCEMVAGWLTELLGEWMGGEWKA